MSRTKSRLHGAHFAPARCGSFFFRAALAWAAVVSVCQPVWATAPIQQVTNPTQFDNLYSVVDMLQDPKLAVGTGSIIDSDVVQQGNEEIGYFCVLTADHVVTPPGLVANQIGFGYVGDGDNPANSFGDTYKFTNVAHGGATGNEDIAVAVVRYGVVDQFFNSVTDLKLWNPPTPAPGTSAADAAQQLADYAKANVTGFTQIGYGNTGTPHVTAGVQDGFNFQSSFGVQRFDNATIANSTPLAPHNGYTYTDVTWNPGPVSPGNPNLGTGSSFTGDSGGPYMTTDPTNYNVNGLVDVLGNAVPQQTIAANTNTIFAVHTFGNNANPQLFAANVASGGVLLSAADVAWINGVCAAVPEPSTYTLAITSMLALVALKRRRVHLQN